MLLNANGCARFEAVDPQVLRAILAEDFMSFVEYAFAVVAPGKCSDRTGISRQWRIGSHRSRVARCAVS